MRFFIFMLVIPVATGVLTSVAGLTYINPETFWLCLSINAPTCVVSTAVYCLT